MQLHTSLTGTQVKAALTRAQRAGLITADVEFVAWSAHGSRTHPHAFEVQLGTENKHSLPPGTVDQHGKRMHVRRYKNSGSRGATSSWFWGESVWAATWHEWGWFIAAVFDADPGARFGSNPARARYPWGYFSPADFNAKTSWQFADLTRLHAIPAEPPRVRGIYPGTEPITAARTEPAAPLPAGIRFTPAGDPAVGSYADTLDSIDAVLAAYAPDC